MVRARARRKGRRTRAASCKNKMVRADIEHRASLVRRPCRIAAPSAVLPGMKPSGCPCRGGPRGRPRRDGLHPNGVHPFPSRVRSLSRFATAPFIQREPRKAVLASRGKGRGLIPVRSTIERQRYASFQATPHCSSGDPGSSLRLPLFCVESRGHFLWLPFLKSKKRSFPTGKECVLTYTGLFRQTRPGIRIATPVCGLVRNDGKGFRCNQPSFSISSISLSQSSS